MPHETSLIATIVAGLVLAYIFGTLANRLRIPPLVGYLLAGVAVGPATPGFVADQGLAPQLAEIGVILLMFGVGLHFSLRDLLSVKAIAVPGAIVQIVVATLLGLGLGAIFGWPLGGGLVFGLALSVASTVVLLRALQERRLLETERGRIAVGWLIVEDLAMVLTLVLLPALAGLMGGEDNTPIDPLVARFGLGVSGVLVLTLAKVAAFVALMLVVGRRVIPWLLHHAAHEGSRELFRLAVLAIALGVAFGAAKLFGVSFALGAFFAGMIMSESELSHQAAQESLPLRDAFAVLFFVSVGMLFDPRILVSHPIPVLATLGVIVIGKSAAAYVIVRLFRHPTDTALTISASLAQIGEFSFILAEMGVGLKLLPEQGRDLILAGAILSMLLNPLIFVAAKRLGARDTAQAKPASPEVSDLPTSTALRDHTVLIGFGRVGAIVGKALKEAKVPLVVIEDSDGAIPKLRAAGIEHIIGNASRDDILTAANVAGARRLIVAIPNAFEAGQAVMKARTLNPRLTVLARTHSDAEVEHLRNLGAEVVIMGEREIARGFIDHVLGEGDAAMRPGSLPAA
jgi:CPA2 family monovalent cation:H+ antiporter-2